jgi:hypothetical protein
LRRRYFFGIHPGPYWRKTIIVSTTFLSDSYILLVLIDKVEYKQRNLTERTWKTRNGGRPRLFPWSWRDLRSPGSQWLWRQRSRRIWRSFGSRQTRRPPLNLPENRNKVKNEALKWKQTVQMVGSFK